MNLGFPCPECGVQQRARAVGSVVACANCGNPLVVPASPSAEGRSDSPGPLVARPSVWGTAALVLAIVAAGHVGLYLLLTAEARSALRRLETRHGLQSLRTARKPEEAPEAGSEAYARWRAGVELFDDARAWRSHRRHVELLRSGFVASFLVQVGVTAWILLRLLGRRRRTRHTPVADGPPVP